MLIENTIEFISSLGPTQLLFYFWPFFVFDLTRYIILDLMILVYYLPKRRMQRQSRLEARQRLFQKRPLVSVIVPGKNEGAHIPELSRSLTRQTYSHLEIVIVDDGSDDNTPVICKQLLKLGRIDQFIRNDIRGGKGSAANTALYYSKGEYIVHLDADSHLADDAIERLLIPFFMDERVGGVGGDIRVANSDHSIATRLQGIEYMKSLSTGRTVSSMLGILRIISGACGAFRRDTLERLGGWDVGPGLDGDITVKIRKLGMRVVHEPLAACYTNVPISFVRLVRQRYRWDRSMVRFRMRKHSDILKPSANFNILNFISSLENIFYNLVLNLKWWVYLFQILLFAEDVVAYIFLINYVLYTMANVIEYGVAVVLFGKTMNRREWSLISFLPLMPLYTGLFLRSVRTFAQIMELFHKASYADRWNPWKVSSVARRDKL